MYHIVNNIYNVLYEKELDNLEQFKRENPGKDVKIYYVTQAQGCGYSFIATTETPKYDNNILYFGNHVDITDYYNRLEEF